MKRTISTLIALLVISAGWAAKTKTPKGFVYIPSSTSTIEGKQVSIMAFYMAEHEVTNLQYRSFLQSLKNENQDSLYLLARPDTVKWNQKGWFMQPMVNMYFWHPAYDNYPVVNITPEGAGLYCKWASAQMRAKYGNHLNDLRVPTKHEWIMAAKGGENSAIYSWGGNSMHNAKGCYMANFLTVGEQNIRVNENGLEVVIDSNYVNSFENNSFATAPVDSYSPNSFGLFNMCGNVAEITAGGKAYGGHWNAPGYNIRITSQMDADASSPFIGFRPIMTYTPLKK